MRERAGLAFPALTGRPLKASPSVNANNHAGLSDPGQRRAQNEDRWLADPDNAPPGGESLTRAAARVGQARDRIIARFARKTVLAVTHVTPIKALICQALGAPLGASHRMELGPASLTVIDYYDDDVASVRCFNDTSYLPV